MFLARGLCYVISVESIPIRDPLFTAIAQGTVSLPGDTFVSPSVVVAVLVVLVGAVPAARHPVRPHGLRHRRQRSSRPMLMGLPVGRTKVAVYAISGLCSALGGLLFAFYSLSGYSLTRSASSSTPSPPPSSAARCSPAASGSWSARCSACWSSA